MRILLFLFSCASCALIACASGPKARYQEEKNQAKFGNTRSYVEAPDDVLLAARAVLDEWSRESDPPAAGSVKSDGDMVQTGWVYSFSKDKYVEYDFNGTVRRKPLALRRRYAYTVTPSLSGSQVIFTVEEELQKIDLKTGKERGWSSSEASPAAFAEMAKRLQEKLRTI